METRRPIYQPLLSIASVHIACRIKVGWSEMEPPLMEQRESARDETVVGATDGVLTFACHTRRMLNITTRSLSTLTANTPHLRHVVRRTSTPNHRRCAGGHVRDRVRAGQGRVRHLPPRRTVSWQPTHRTHGRPQDRQKCHHPGETGSEGIGHVAR